MCDKRSRDEREKDAENRRARPRSVRGHGGKRRCQQSMPTGSRHKKSEAESVVRIDLAISLSTIPKIH
jgi:hypothetical protein